MAATTGSIPARASYRATRRWRSSDIVLIATVIFAFGWAVARALIQSISIDEAESYLSFVKRGWHFVFWPTSNNHVLYSILARLFTHWFGASQFTVRMPALVGALAYMSAAYILARLISRSLILQWSVLACLIFNPLLFDFYVAARGYSLAAGFLLLALAIVARGSSNPQPRSSSHLGACAIASVCLALSFAGNYSFALADGAILVTMFCWIGFFQRPESAGKSGWLSLTAAALVVPGLVVALAITGHILMNFPKDRLYFGSQSIAESLSSVYYPSLTRMEFIQVSPAVSKLLGVIRTLVAPILAGLAILQLALIVVMKSWRANRQSRWLLSLAAVTAAALAISLALHFAAFQVAHLLLPKQRTGLFLVPLFTLLICAVVALPMQGRFGRTIRSFSIAALFCLAGYYLTCLRLHYFEEWWWDADVKDAYQVLAALNHRCSVSTASADGLYGGVLNFYRSISGRETIPEFQVVACCVPGRDAYVLNADTNSSFLKANKLVPVFRGRWASTLVALSPETAGRVESSGCYPVPPSNTLVP